MGQRVQAGLMGLAIGDALGVPVEFESREALREYPVKGMAASYRGFELPPGTWSDDTSMTLCLVKSLIDKRKLDYDDIMNNFTRWLMEGEFTATGTAFDIGGTCSRALHHYIQGNDPLNCGGKSENTNGNGSLMRILPVAYLCYQNNLNAAERFELVKQVSSLTHAHPVSVAGCMLYIDFVCDLLAGKSPEMAYEDMCSRDHSYLGKKAVGVYDWLFHVNLSCLSEVNVPASGYVHDTLVAAFWCLLTSKSYREAVLKAVNFGGDADTIGAVTGSLAGIAFGYGDIPKQWLAQLQRGEDMLRLCDRFCDVLPDIEV